MLSCIDKPRTPLESRYSTTLSDTPTKPAAQVIAAMARPPENVVAGNEIVFLAVKPSLWRPIIESSPVLIVVSALFMTLSILNTSWVDVSFSLSMKMLLAVAFARLTVAIVCWVPMWYMLTNRRVIAISGIRTPQIVSCLLLDIRNTHLDVTLPERVTGIGSISFVTDSPSRQPIHWANLAKPTEVHTEIRKAIENAIDQHNI